MQCNRIILENQTGHVMYFSRESSFFMAHMRKGKSAHMKSEYKNKTAGDAIEINDKNTTFLKDTDQKEFDDSGLHHFDRAHDVLNARVTVVTKKTDGRQSGLSDPC